MGAKSAIEWCDSTWNPVTGCTKVSPGCKFCYAERIFKRLNKEVVETREGSFVDGLRPRRFTDIRLHEDRLGLPLRWRRPRRIFVNSVSDLFHEAVPEPFLDRIFATMVRANRHTFQILTKRPERMRQYLTCLGPTSHALTRGTFASVPWPLPNVWAGVSAEDQQTADERTPLLLQTPAAVRFVSLEPLLGPISLMQLTRPFYETLGGVGREVYPLEGLMAIPDSDWNVPALDWVIVGGESGGPPERSLVRNIGVAGHPARALYEPTQEAHAWVREIRDQCIAAGVPFFFKQWGGPTPKSGGRLLDGRTWDEIPKGVIL